MIGVEPTRLAAPDPKSGASANFATSAFPLPGGKSRGFTQKIMVKLVPLFGSLVTEIVPPQFIDLMLYEVQTNSLAVIFYFSIALETK